MKLTKLQRYTAYCIALSELEEYAINKDSNIASDGFCFLMFHLFELSDMVKGYCNSLKLFPEIKKRGKRNTANLWFDANQNGGVGKRIAILNNAIKEIHPR